MNTTWKTTVQIEGKQVDLYTSTHPNMVERDLASPMSMIKEIRSAQNPPFDDANLESDLAEGVFYEYLSMHRKGPPVRLPVSRVDKIPEDFFPSFIGGTEAQPLTFVFSKPPGLRKH